MEVIHSQSHLSNPSLAPLAGSPPIPNKARSSSPYTQESKRFYFYQYLAFFLTAFLYSMSHALRTSWGYVKSDLLDANTYYTSAKLGILDFSFTISYAIGQYVNGWLGDRVNLKVFLFGGTVFAITGACLFGYLEGVVLMNNLAVGILLFVINGLGQSTGYPSCISILSNWFTTGKIGLIFGLWGTSLNIGNIIGQQIGKITVTDEGHEWEYALYVTSIVLGSILLCLVFLIKIHPRDLEKHNTQQEQEPLLGDSTRQEAPNTAVHHGHHGGQAIGFLQAWNIKNVPYFALGFFCVKGVTYGVMFWLPFYLVNEAELEGDISYILASIEIGMIVGSVILGFLSDRVRSRAIIIAFGFFFAVIFLLMTCLIKDMKLKILYFALLFLAGVGIGGPSSLIGGAVSSDLGREMAEKSSMNATATVTGIMEGCGALGAAITQIIISNFTSITFPFFGSLCLIGGLLMSPIAWKDYCRLKRERREALLRITEDYY